jgi:predicted ester cyclase
MKQQFNKELVISYIYDIWNKEKFERLFTYIHPDFIDHSLPKPLPTNSEGLMLWIMGTSKSFEHKTTIEDMVCEDNKVMIRVKMQMKHIGLWRAIEPTGAEIATVGYRHFRIEDGKIIEHWALVDGASIENQIKNTITGCKIQE